MAETQTSIDQASKQGIINHMNAKQTGTLVLYLKVYCRFHPESVDSIKMVDITFSDMIISTRGTHYCVPIDPPMKSLHDARRRLIDMRNHCLTTLGLSVIMVKEYRIPHGISLLGVAILLALYALFSQRSNFLPGSIVYSLIFERMPSFSKFCYKIQPIFIPTIFAIHAVEACYLATQLRRYHVPFLSKLWLAWIVSSLIDGIFTLERFGAILREERLKQEEHKFRPYFTAQPHCRTPTYLL
jgi:hypothetical protein